MVERYMRYRLAHAGSQEKVGGYKHQLPAGKDGEPAPLPKPVLEWEEKEKADETGEGLDGTSADDLESKYQPDAHYELDQDTDTDTAMLRHVATGDEVMLDTGVRYKLYNTTSGWCLWAGGQATPEYACDVMISVAMSEKEAVKSRRVAGSMTAGAAPMRGMERTGELELSCLKTRLLLRGGRLTALSPPLPLP